ncbi:alpha-2-macroglobulin family protein [Desulfobacter vibrioformis]|uniref:alpha-2-macroglobulin family protein n=1 Tax=Desulfobacter vibrioformis TaxID=34031 RepID=UPI00068B4121|nr:alpha-2-macroglobulin [Desulfobacter vibrioformis]
MKQFRLIFLPVIALCLSLFALQVPAQSAELEARFSGQQTVDGQNALAVTFSLPLDAKQDLGKYFSITEGDGDDATPVDGAWILAKDTKVAYFTQIKPDTAYTIHVAKGLAPAQGEALAGKVIYEITTRSAQPMISFGSTGFILAPDLIKGLPVDSLNIKQADIDFFRVRPDRLTGFKDEFWNSTYLSYYDSDALGAIAELVYSGRWDLDVKKDLRTRFNIPITHIRELKTPGIYIAVLRGAGLYRDGYRMTWFSISDLGVHARVYDTSLRFFIQSLSTADPIGKAVIKGFDADGKTLFEQATDNGGLCVIKGHFEKLKLVSVSKKYHISLMAMDTPALDLSEFAMGHAPFRPLDLFVYGPRDIYRPGETVVIDGILRNQDGQMAPAIKVAAKVVQPDGKTIREFTWKPGNGNHFNTSVQLPANALTGKWRVKFSNGKDRFEDYPFLVSEFLPERMKLVIDQTGDNILAPDKDLAIHIQGDFLYGAPAGGSRANAVIHVKPARDLFKKTLPGFEFGAITDLVNTTFTCDDIRLDETGKGVIDVDNQWKAVTSPHWVTANVSLYDSGERPVVRNASWQVWPAQSLVGIRNMSGTQDDPEQVPGNDTAKFEVVLADTQGRLRAAHGLKVTVIREHREYYWEYKDDAWHWGCNSQFYPVDRFDLDIPDQGRAQVTVPVEWGGYRIEIKNPATGLTSCKNVWAGWRSRGQDESDMNRPDRVDLTLDKPGYRAGDTARVTVKAPQGGKGFLFVDGADNLLTLPIDIPAQGKEISIPVHPDWARHDLYVSALVIRPGESRNAKLPKRSVGLIHLPLDRTGRRMKVDIQAPEKTEPNCRVDVAVNLTDAGGKPARHAMVTLAAVDSGILNLTRFKTPDPFGYFFQPRKYSPELHDIYQKLIEAADGSYARMRFGGDAAALTRGGDRPSTDVQILAIHQKAVDADDQGKAVFHLDLPDFDGQVRIMAIAHTDNTFGSEDKEMILASPIVVQATMPRFLSCGDQGFIMLELNNLTDIAQNITLETEIFGPVSLTGQAAHTIALEPHQRTSVKLPVTAGTTTGRAHITCRLKGIQGPGVSPQMTKTWFLETRSPYPHKTRTWQKLLKPGQRFSTPSAVLDTLVPDTVTVLASLDSEPPVNLAQHVSELLAYPYGCLEQTVSGFFPHVLLSFDQFAQLGVEAGTREATNEKIRRGIQGLLEKQKSSGAFGLWSSQSPESPWLTAYAAHMMVEAVDAGYEVPVNAVKKALTRLAVYVRRPKAIPCPGWTDDKMFRAATRAYAAFVLARISSLGLADARNVYAYVKANHPTPLGLVHAGTALGLAGDRTQAFDAFDLAIKTRRNDKQVYCGDYGSNVRDLAAAYYYVTTFFTDYAFRGVFLHDLAHVIKDRHWLSTQERNSLVMAGAAKLAHPAGAWAADVTVGNQAGAHTGKGPGRVIFTKGTAAKGFTVNNTGKSNLYLDLVLTGYPNSLPAPQSHGVSISRQFLDTNATPVDISTVVSGDRIIVALKVESQKQKMPHALVVDMLPAGFELEDPNVSGSFLIDDIKVDGKTISQWHGGCHTAHTEYRDDRFISALDLGYNDACRIFYAVRVVSPGVFKVPPPLVEDMYRPYIRGVGETIVRTHVSSPGTGEK